VLDAQIAGAATPLNEPAAPAAVVEIRCRTDQGPAGNSPPLVRRLPMLDHRDARCSPRVRATTVPGSPNWRHSVLDPPTEDAERGCRELARCPQLCHRTPRCPTRSVLKMYALCDGPNCFELWRLDRTSAARSPRAAKPKESFRRCLTLAFTSGGPSLHWPPSGATQVRLRCVYVR